MVLEQLSEAEQRAINGLDREDFLAWKLCLLSTGALVGLSLKGSFVRRLAGLACACLSAGLAIPLAARYAEVRSQEEAPAERLQDE